MFGVFGGVFKGIFSIMALGSRRGGMLNGVNDKGIDKARRSQRTVLKGEESIQTAEHI